ncbi:MAG: transglycosylase family protein [Solirubrobacterales bacterium]
MPPPDPSDIAVPGLRPTPGALVVALLLPALAATLSPFSPPASAEPSREEQRLERAESRVERLSDQLTGSRRQFDRLDRQAESARIAEAGIETRLADGERRLVEIESQLRLAERAADRAGRRLGIARTRLADRLVAIYQSGTADAVAILLSTEDFGVLASTGTYLDAIAESERDLAARVADLRAQRLDALAEVGRTRELLASELDGLRAARESAASARVEAQDSMQRLSSIQGERQRRIEQLKGQVELIESEIASSEGAPNFAGGPYAIPTYIVMCESGGNYSALNPSSGAGGAYQIIPSTWEAYGGEGLPHQAPKAEQDRIARLIWESAGPGAWVCA